MVTDRQELDEQIYKTFAATGAVTASGVHAESGVHLKELLTADHRYVFTLIHKFSTRDGATYPELSDRRDIIVITDGAHRIQYDTLALNMRNALPNAALLGFTGTPLMAGEEKTREIFGDYISVYNFAQSIADGATVPFYFENRISELKLTNEVLGDDMQQLLEDADLDEAQERKVTRKKYSSEEKIKIVLDGLGGEDSVAELCRRKGQGYKNEAYCAAAKSCVTVSASSIRKDYFVFCGIR